MEVHTSTPIRVFVINVKWFTDRSAFGGELLREVSVKYRFAALDVSRPSFAAPRQHTSFASRKPWLVPPSGSSSRIIERPAARARLLLAECGQAKDPGFI